MRVVTRRWAAPRSCVTAADSLSQRYSSSSRPLLISETVSSADEGDAGDGVVGFLEAEEEQDRIVMVGLVGGDQLGGNIAKLGIAGVQVAVRAQAGEQLGGVVGFDR